MPIPPAVATQIASEVAETPTGKRMLGMVGGVVMSLLVGVGSGVVGTGKAIGDALAGAEAKSAAQGQILVAVANQYQQQVDALRLELAQADIELAICEERSGP